MKQVQHLSNILFENAKTKNPILDLGNLGLDGTEAELQLIKDFYWLETVIFGNYWHKYNSENFSWEIQKNERYDDTTMEIYKERQNVLIVSPNFLPPQLKQLNLIGEFCYYNLPYKVMDDISFLQNLPLLETLELEYYPITDLSVFQSLKNLKTLCLDVPTNDYEYLGNLDFLKFLKIGSFRNIKKASFFKNLSNIEYLDLGYNNFFDLEALHSLTKLKYLNFNVSYNSTLTNLDLLANLTSLTFLHIYTATQNIDFSFIKNLTKLKTLSIKNSVQKEEIKTYNFLSELENLEDLTISEGGLQDLTPIRNLTKLTSLHLPSNQIEKINLLANLKNLKKIRLTNNKKIKNISGIYHLRNLEELHLRDCCIDELHLDENVFPNLKYADFSSNHFTNLSIHNLLNLEDMQVISVIDSLSLKNLPALKKLHIYNNAKIKNLILEDLNNVKTLNIYVEQTINEGSDFLKGLPFLKELELNLRNTNSFECLEFLENKQVLEKLKVYYPLFEYEDNYEKHLDSYTKILSQFSNLKDLHLEDCHIQNIDFLQNMLSLEKLSIISNLNSSIKINNIELLANLKELKTLNLSNNTIIDITPIIHLEKLEEVCMSNNKLTRLDYEWQSKNIKKLYFSENQIENIDINDLPNLSELSFWENDEYYANKEELVCYLKSISLKNLPKLKKINYRGNGYYYGKYSTSLISLPNTLENCDIENVPLEELWLPNCNLKDFSFLKNTSQTLISLSMTGNNLSDFPISDVIFPKLETLIISKNPLTNISFTQYFPKIKNLHISNTQIKTLKVIDLPCIEEITCNFGEGHILKNVIVKNSKVFQFRDSSCGDEGGGFYTYVAHTAKGIHFEADAHYYQLLGENQEKYKKEISEKTSYYFDFQNHNNVTLADLPNVVTLSFGDGYEGGKMIVDIAEIVQFNPKITSLSFSNVILKNFASISKITNLEGLSFWNCENNEKDLPDLLPKLTSLYYNYSDFDAFILLQSPNLESFGIKENINVAKGIERLEINKMLKLKYVGLEIRIDNLFIQDCPLLEDVKIEYSANLHIDNLPKLKKLSTNSFTNLFLQNCIELEELTTEYIQKIHIENTPKLVTLALKNTRKGFNLYFLKNLLSLESFSLENFDTKEGIENIGLLKNLHSLVLKNYKNFENSYQYKQDYNDFFDISFVSKIYNLKKLYLKALNIVDINPLQDLILLEELDLAYNQINNISSLTFFLNLKTLNLNHNKIVNITPIKKLQKLEVLNLQHNQIINISVIENFNDLERLNVSHNGITNFEAIKKIEYLWEFYVSHNNFGQQFPHWLVLFIYNKNQNITINFDNLIEPLPSEIEEVCNTIKNEYLFKEGHLWANFTNEEIAQQKECVKRLAQRFSWNPEHIRAYVYFMGDIYTYGENHIPNIYVPNFQRKASNNSYDDLPF